MSMERPFAISLNDIDLEGKDVDKEQMAPLETPLHKEIRDLFSQSIALQITDLEKGQALQQTLNGWHGVAKNREPWGSVTLSEQEVEVDSDQCLSNEGIPLAHPLSAYIVTSHRRVAKEIYQEVVKAKEEFDALPDAVKEFISSLFRIKSDASIPVGSSPISSKETTMVNASGLNIVVSSVEKALASASKYGDLYSFLIDDNNTKLYLGGSYLKPSLIKALASVGCVRDTDYSDHTHEDIYSDHFGKSKHLTRPVSQWLSKVNCTTWQVQPSTIELERRERSGGVLSSVLWEGNRKSYEPSYNPYISTLKENEEWLCRIDLEDPKWYDFFQTIQFYQVRMDLSKLFTLWDETHISTEQFLEILGHPLFSDLLGNLQATLNRARVTLDEVRPRDDGWYTNWLLHCDTIRANTSPYHENTLIDPNRGHWELFDEFRNSTTPVATQDLGGRHIVFARPPQLDVLETAVCAIDFGTKSTVVACRNRGSRLLRIGTGDYEQAPRKEDYENPTTVYFKDIATFLNAYLAQEGRPYTKWSDLMVSHHAAEHLYCNVDDKNTYYATFSELKQWANDKKRHQILQDEQGNSIELIPYLTMADNDGYVDPVELYAYYLGLYINNMTNGIYMSYILSFPVNYEKAVQNKLLQSFEKGLKKSLPPSILEDEESMAAFEVYAGASEPAAYAISALEAYGLEPTEIGSKVAYGVFDFGGGTTDFDFGIATKPDHKRSKIEIEQFGKGGDPYLGGENLLQIIAYETYIQNLGEMRKNNIQIVLPKKCTPAAGTEILVQELDQASQEAYLNMKVLMKELRPIWEEHDNMEQKFTAGDYTVGLYVKSQGQLQKIDVSLRVNIPHLQSVLTNHIQIGITSFMNKLLAVFDKEKDIPYPIHIFLAGNSCQSKIAQELFAKSIMAFMKKMERTHELDASTIYRLYPPLGNTFDVDALEEQFPDGEDKELLRTFLNTTSAIQADTMAIDQIRTGKTGVVFGLLRSRRGGKDVRIINNNEVELGTGEVENTFPYFLGNEGSYGMFHSIIFPAVPYGQWAEFDYGDENKFELYYTNDARAYEDQVPIEEVKQVICRIDESHTDENAMIWIRKVAIDTIEYVVTKDPNFSGDVTGLIVYTKKLP